MEPRLPSCFLQFPGVVARLGAAPENCQKCKCNLKPGVARPSLVWLSRGLCGLQSLRTVLLGALLKGSRSQPFG